MKPAPKFTIEMGVTARDTHVWYEGIELRHIVSVECEQDVKGTSHLILEFSAVEINKT